MRKFSLLLVALLAVSGMAFAQVAIEPTIEVEASATFGVQLDEMTTGISNAAESTLSFVFTEEQTSEFGEGEVYGWIELEEFKVEFESDGDDSTDEGALDVSVGSVTGKVFFGPAYISLDEATVEANEASAFALIDQSLVAYTETVGADIGTKYSPEYPGVALGFELPDVATVEFGVASKFDWAEESESVTPSISVADWVAFGLAADEDGDGEITTADYDEWVADNSIKTVDGANDGNAYVMSIDAEITAVENVTIALVSTMEFGTPTTDKDGESAPGTVGTNGNPAGVGLSFEYDLMVQEGVTLTPVFGFDLTTEQDGAEDQEMNMEFGLGAKLSWADLGLDEDEDDHIDFIGNADDEEEVTSGAYLGAVYGIHSSDLLGTTADEDETINTLGIRFGVYEDGGDDGLLPVLGAALMVEYTSALENEDGGLAETRSDLGIGVEINADLGVVSPYAGFKYIANDLEGNTLEDPKDATKTKTDTFATMNIGTDINVISNTTFTIDYASGDLLWNKDEAGMDDPTYGDTYGNISSSDAMAGVLTIETTVEF